MSGFQPFPGDDFRGRRAIVTGAGSGIGLETRERPAGSRR